MTLQVAREQLTGGVDMDFFNLPVTNAYNNLTAISMRIATPASKGVKSVLVNAHFDSVFGTTGMTVLIRCTSAVGQRFCC